MRALSQADRQHCSESSKGILMAENFSDDVGGEGVEQGYIRKTASQLK